MVTWGSNFEPSTLVLTGMARRFGIENGNKNGCGG